MRVLIENITSIFESVRLDLSTTRFPMDIGFFLSSIILKENFGRRTLSRGEVKSLFSLGDLGLSLLLDFKA